MLKPVADNVEILSQLTNDDFIGAFDVCLTLLERNIMNKRESQSKKGETVKGAEALYDVLETMIEESTIQEELQKLLLSYGLQKEKVSLLVSQIEHIKELKAKNKFGNFKGELIDLQWKFGVVAGSSISEETGRSFVQVKLVCRSSEGSISSRHIEMSLEKFYYFLHQLEKAKASLEYIKYL